MIAYAPADHPVARRLPRRPRARSSTRTSTRGRARCTTSPTPSGSSRRSSPSCRGGPSSRACALPLELGLTVGDRRWLLHVEGAASRSRVEPDKLSRRHLTLSPAAFVRLAMGHTGIDRASAEDGFESSTGTAHRRRPRPLPAPPDLAEPARQRHGLTVDIGRGPVAETTRPSDRRRRLPRSTPHVPVHLRRDQVDRHARRKATSRTIPCAIVPVSSRSARGLIITFSISGSSLAVIVRSIGRGLGVGLVDRVGDHEREVDHRAERQGDEQELDRLAAEELDRGEDAEQGDRDEVDRPGRPVAPLVQRPGPSAPRSPPGRGRRRPIIGIGRPGGGGGGRRREVVGQVDPRARSPGRARTSGRATSRPGRPRRRSGTAGTAPAPRPRSSCARGAAASSNSASASAASPPGRRPRLRRGAGGRSVIIGRSNVSRRSPRRPSASPGRSPRAAASRSAGRRGRRARPPRRAGGVEARRVVPAPAVGPTWNFSPHFGHFRRRPAAFSGRFRTTPQWMHWMVRGMFRGP